MWSATEGILHSERNIFCRFGRFSVRKMSVLKWKLCLARYCFECLIIDTLTCNGSVHFHSRLMDGISNMKGNKDI